MKKHAEKKRKNKIIVLISALLIIAGFWYFETYTLTVTNEEIHDDRINSDITIVQITDLHGAKFGHDNSRLISLIDKQKPDVVFATGDMYTNGDENGIKTAVDLLSALAEKYDVYLISGEHDDSDNYFEQLENAKVHVMNYETELLKIRDNEIRLYGINNSSYTYSFDLNNAFTPDDEHYSILLAHISNFEKFRDFGIDLSICGDTHGGQIRLPAIGAVYNSGIWFPETINKTDSDLVYTKGLFERDGKYLFVSSGLGNSIPIRLFNRPEIAVITLKK